MSCPWQSPICSNPECPKLIDAAAEHVDGVCFDFEIHLLSLEMNPACNADNALSNADINFVTCEECIAIHDAYVIRDSQQ